MRNPWITLDTRDRQAIAGGAAAGSGLMTLLALRADWVLASGIVTFQRTGQNVAAYVMGIDLLPWTLVFTAAIAAMTLVTFGLACGRAPVGRAGTTLGHRTPRHVACGTQAVGG